MGNLVLKLLNNDKVRYLIAGACTTAVNFVCFFMLRYFTDISRNVCNVIAVSAAIAFAYFANKFFVFKSHSGSTGRLLIEFVSFIGARLVSMAVEVIGLSLLCDSFRINEIVAKIGVQVAVVVINYVFSKIFVFNGDERGLRERVMKNRSWLLAGLITFIFMIFVMVIGRVAPFGERSFTIVDSLHQYLPFFSDYQDKLKNEGNMFYTWDIGLGVNFMSLFMYYLASPINLIIIFFNRMGLPAAMSIIATLKITITAMTFGYYLSRRRNRVSNNYYITAFAVAFALSNYVVGYYWNIMWMDCIMVFPLIILGFERMMEKRDIKLYCLSMFYCMYCNYYIAFIICIFMVLWFLAYSHKNDSTHENRSAMASRVVPSLRSAANDSTHENRSAIVSANIKKFFSDGLLFAGTSILSAGMAAFSLLASYLAIMTTASAKAGLPEHSWYGNIFLILKQHLFLTEPIKNQTFDGGANIYCGIFTILLLFIYIFTEKIPLAERIRKIILLAIIAVSFNSTLLNFIWHGFHDQYGIPNRFSFVYIFVLLYIGYEMVGRIKTVHPAYIVSGLFLTISFFLLCKYEAGDFERGWLMVLLSSGLAVIYAVMLILRKTGAVKGKIISVITSVFFMAEILVNAAFGFTSNGNADTGYYMQHVEEMQDMVSYISEYSEEQNYGFYREELADPIMLDEATLNNMKSVGTFCSTVRGDTVTVMARLGFYTAANEYLYKGATPVTNSMLGVRYVYVRDGEYFAEENTMELVAETDEVKVYENKYTLPIAYAVESSIYDWDRDLGKASECLNNFVHYAVGTSDIFTEVPIPDMTVSSGTGCQVSYSPDSRQISYTGATENSLNIMASFTVSKAGDYYMNLRGNYMRELTFYINGTELTDGRYQQQMFHIGNLEAGDIVTIEIDFSSGFSENGTLTANLSEFNIEEFEKYYAEISRYPLDVEEWDDGYIKGNITVNSDMTLFTSIPYDKGWRVYIDGERAEIKEAGEAFLTVDLTEGSHNIEMIYYPEGLFLGMGLSAVSWIIFCILLLKRRTKIEEMTNYDIDRK